MGPCRDYVETIVSALEREAPEVALGEALLRFCWRAGLSCRYQLALWR